MLQFEYAYFLLDNNYDDSYNKNLTYNDIINKNRSMIMEPILEYYKSDK